MIDVEKITEEFWDALDDSPVVMLGLAGMQTTHMQPMQAFFDDDYPNNLYFFTKIDNSLVTAIPDGGKATIAFAAKGHDVFASVEGSLAAIKDKALIDRFWSPTLNAWYESGQEDPKLTMLKFDMDKGEIWKAGSGEFLRYMLSAFVRGTATDAAKKDHAEVAF
ncbi:MAG: pyridoxamine 5'-phosphate oxidase family protein [Pseudomonadota bacterium]